MIFVSIILVLLLSGTGYACYNLLLQNEKLEESLLEHQEAINFYVEIIEDARQKGEKSGKDAERSAVAHFEKLRHR